ncbi:aldehyde dehydrogenase [Echinicola pacifica]|uniref:Aldehyde dehydrogenase n=1 Tax=Echinicola pacifica TaxID=346377 RepID=A0A918PQG0_9BACT|nr:aldehyde dehydrogenase family protein [Echinicola pacifica]GGZ18251.1 aldehyde dehydrogenase [Echinicola pacifica]
MTEEIFNNQIDKAKKNRTSPLQDRLNRLLRLKEWIKDHQKEIEKALYSDLKKPSTEANITETSFVVMEINHALKNLKKWAGPHAVKTPSIMMGTQAYIQAEPKGVALIISPWNYPFSLCIGPLVSAIAAGCSVFLKPSEHTPHSSALIRRLVAEVFLPEDVMVYEGGVSVTEDLLTLPFDHIFFTGSTKVGKVIMKAAAKNLSSVTLELGGKCPVVIDKGYDLKDAARKIIAGKFMNCGQTCIAPDHVYVHEANYEEFISLLIEQLRASYNPKEKGYDQTKDYGRIVNENHMIRLQDLLNDAQNKGARLLEGGKYSIDNKFFAPTLIDQISENMQIMQEEIFGPILPILTYHQLDEVIEDIQNRYKPLSVYVFTKEEYVEELFRSRTSSGSLVINDCNIQFVHNELPFGGVGRSGQGRGHGQAGFMAFSNPKSVLKQRTGKTLPRLLYPPYGLKTKGLVKTMMKWILRG